MWAGLTSSRDHVWPIRRQVGRVIGRQIMVRRQSEVATGRNIPLTLEEAV